MSLADLKKNRGSSIASLSSKLNEMNGPARGGDGIDELLWKPTIDKAGNGYAVIRFLPTPEGEDSPFARIWDHGFQGPGGWYIEKSRTTLGEADPMSEYNSELWSSGREEDKETVRKQKRRTSYYANIQVLQDPDNPSNEGKVFMYKFGKKIFDMIEEAINPPKSKYDQKEAFNPFDFWEGANFRMKIRKVGGFRNYDQSHFDDPSQLADDDELEAIYEQQHSLSALLDPKNFKSYEDLKARMEKVCGVGVARPAPTPVAPAPKPAPAPAAADDDVPWDTTPAASSDDDDLSFFKSLADD